MCDVSVLKRTQAGMHVSVPLWNMTGPLWNMTGETWPKPWEIDDVYSVPVRGLDEASRWQPPSRPPTQEPHRLHDLLTIPAQSIKPRLVSLTNQ